MGHKMTQKFSNSAIIPSFVAKVQLFPFLKCREKAIRMTGRHWLVQRHFFAVYRQETVIDAGKEL